MSGSYSLRDMVRFIRELAPKRNILLFHSDLEAKKKILLSYLSSSISKGHLGIYIAGEESLEQIENYITKYSRELIDRGLLKILSWDLLHHILYDWRNIVETWGKFIEECVERNLKNPRICSEMDILHKYLQSRRLIEWERLLHERLEIPSLGICSYNVETLINRREYDMLDLIKVHEYTIVTKAESAFVIHM